MIEAGNICRNEYNRIGVVKEVSVPTCNGRRGFCSLRLSYFGMGLDGDLWHAWLPEKLSESLEAFKELNPAEYAKAIGQEKKVD